MCEVGPIFMNVIQKAEFIHSDEFGLKIKFFVLLIFFFYIYNFIFHIMLRPHLTSCLSSDTYKYKPDSSSLTEAGKTVRNGA